MPNAETMPNRICRSLIIGQNGLRGEAFGFNSSFVIRISSFNRQKRHYAGNNKNINQRDFEEKEPT
jgi:hypothetical protein